MTARAVFNTPNTLTVTKLDGEPYMLNRKDIEYFISVPTGSVVYLAPVDGEPRDPVWVVQAPQTIANYFNGRPSEEYRKEVLMPRVLERQRDELEKERAKLQKDVLETKIYTDRTSLLLTLKREEELMDALKEQYEQVKSRSIGLAITHSLYQAAKAKGIDPKDSVLLKIASIVFFRAKFQHGVEEYAERVGQGNAVSRRIKVLSSEMNANPPPENIISMEDYLERERQIRRDIKSDKMLGDSGVFLTQLEHQYETERKPQLGEGFRLFKDTRDNHPLRYIYIREDLDYPAILAKALNATIGTVRPPAPERAPIPAQP